jgi:hypothetical protein
MVEDMVDGMVEGMVEVITEGVIEAVIMVGVIEVEVIGEAAFGSADRGGIRGGVYLPILIITRIRPLSFSNNRLYMMNNRRPSSTGISVRKQRLITPT